MTSRSSPPGIRGMRKLSSEPSRESFTRRIDFPIPDYELVAIFVEISKNGIPRCTLDAVDRALRAEHAPALRQPRSRTCFEQRCRCRHFVSPQTSTDRDELPTVAADISPSRPDEPPHRFFTTRTRRRSVVRILPVGVAVVLASHRSECRGRSSRGGARLCRAFPPCASPEDPRIDRHVERAGRQMLHGAHAPGMRLHERWPVRRPVPSATPGRDRRQLDRALAETWAIARRATDRRP